jgi:hypothetical protein
MKKLLLSTMAAASLVANDTQSTKAPEATSVVTESTTTALIPALIKDFMPTSGIANNSNLALSLIVDTSFVVRSKKDEELAHMGLPGVAHSLIGSHDHDGHNHATYDAQNGFNLNYAELGFTGTVDPYLDASVFLHFYDGGVEVEEAYFTSRNLPYNLRLRGGKFFSDFGRQNNQHHHAWQFSDMPLVYEAFLGNHGIQEIGAQLQWIAPTSNYLMFGLEALQGKNEMMFGHEAIANSYDEDNSLAQSASQPSLFVGYVKTSADIGDTTILAGASVAKGESRMNHLDDEEESHAFSGDSTLYGVDLTVKHFFDSYSSLTWQTEWLYRDIKGTEFDDNGASFDLESLRKKQAGYYTQLVYAPDQSWRMGLKYDNIYKNDVIVEGTNENKPKNMDQYTAMVEYHSSEFARYRLQYSHSNALFSEDEQRQNLDSLIFSVNIALGRHNAHPF